MIDDIRTTVLVTGATGYVAGPLVKKLLEAGCTVHAPVREPDNEKKVGHLKALAAKLSGKLILSKADLLKPGSYNDAMKDCSVVFHTASPFKLTIKDPQKDLVDPALEGTRNILNSVNDTPSVRRVVLTSSVAAMYCDNTDINNNANGKLTEENWNTGSSLSYNPYAYSKTLAEKEAWKIVNEQSRWTLVVINPALVIGPTLNENSTSESFNLIKRMGDGTMRFGAPKWGVGVVDVRDVASAHFKAAFDESASGRHIICAQNTDFFALSQLLRDKFEKDYPVPKSVAPKWLLWLVGPFVDKNMSRDMIKKNVNHPWVANNQKSIEQLGITYRPVKQSIEDMFAQLINMGAFK